MSPPLDSSLFDSTSESDAHKESIAATNSELEIDLNPQTQLEQDLFSEEHNETIKEEDKTDHSESSMDSENTVSTASESDESSGEEYSEQEDDKKGKKKLTATPKTPNSKVMEARKDFEEALARISNSSSRRKAVSDSGSQSFSESVEHDDLALALKNRMELALKRDIQSLSNGKPALERIRLLDHVLQALNRKNLQEILIENGILTILRRWLEPLSANTSCTLPSASFRKPILEALKALPIETAHLRESGIGRIVYFFSKREGELADIRKLSTELVDQWSRPIIAGSRFNMTREEDLDASSGTSTPKLLESEGFQRHLSPSVATINTLSVYQKLTSKRTNRHK